MNTIVSRKKLLAESKNQYLRAGLKMSLLSSCLGNEQNLFLYKLQNLSNQNECVTECEVNLLQGDWIILQSHHLKPFASGLVLIGLRRNS